MLDRRRLTDLMRDMGVSAEELNRELLVPFFAETEKTVTQLSRLVDAGDQVAITDEAHKLRGEFQNLGLPVLADLCFAIMNLSKTGEEEGVKSRLKGLKEELAQAKVELAEFVRSMVV